MYEGEIVVVPGWSWVRTNLKAICGMFNPTSGKISMVVSLRFYARYCATYIVAIPNCM